VRKGEEQLLHTEDFDEPFEIVSSSTPSASSAFAFISPRARKRGCHHPVHGAERDVRPVGVAGLILWIAHGRRCMASLASSWKLVRIVRLPGLVHCGLRRSSGRLCRSQYNFFSSGVGDPAKTERLTGRALVAVARAS